MYYLIGVFLLWGFIHITSKRGTGDYEIWRTPWHELPELTKWEWYEEETKLHRALTNQEKRYFWVLHWKRNGCTSPLLDSDMDETNHEN